MFLKIYENLIIARNNFRDNLVRSLISIMGVTVSVASVLAILSVGIGAESAINNKISGLGPNLITVLPGGGSDQNLRFTGFTKSNLTVEDARAIEKECPSVRYAVPVLSDFATCKYNKNTCITSISGTTPDYYAVRNWFVDVGRPFDLQDFNSQRSVCLLGRTVAKKLFGEENPIGKVIKIENASFKVIGLLQEKGMILIKDMDDTLFMPMTAMRKKLNAGKTKYITNILVQPLDADRMESSKREITDLLRKRNNLKAEEKNNFTVGSQTEIFSTLSFITHIITLMLGGISCISILVGGIGIMNIMLVSVGERTREIGIRKAVGANTQDILIQFLMESMLLSLTGAFIGIVIGIGFSEILSYIIHLQAKVPVNYIIFISCISALVGLLAGVYPALSASRLDPIDALRYD